MTATPAQVRQLAPAQPSLAALDALVRSCTACPELAVTRTQVVPGVIPDAPRLLVVGEAPGAQEDTSGLPFIGRSGQLLDELLADVGLQRAQVAVLNTLKCRPPGNRAPTRAESAACRPWTERQLALSAAPVVVSPVVVALGLSAARWFLGPTSLAAVRGRAHDVVVAGRALRVVPTYHPSAALRFGPKGEPRRLLREDLALAVGLAHEVGPA